MANFCTKCGKPLVDGQPCDCMSKQTVNPETPAEKKVVKKVIKRKVVKKPMNIWEMFLAVLKAPVTSMEQVVHERYFVNGMLLCLIECALMSLSVCVLISSSIRMTYNGISSFANSFGGGYSMGGSYSNYVNIPYFEIFFKLLIFYLIIKFLFVMVSMGLLNGMGKAKLTFKASFSAVSGYSTGMILGMVVSIVLTFLNPVVGLLCICLTSFLALIMHTVSITGIKGIHRNICGWISFLTIMINSIITLIVFAIFAQSFMNQIQHSISNGLGGLF